MKNESSRTLNVEVIYPLEKLVIPMFEQHGSSPSLLHCEGSPLSIGKSVPHLRSGRTKVVKVI